MKRPAACLGWLVFYFAGCATSPLIPKSIPTTRSALGPLTAELRAKERSLGLNGLMSPRRELVSRALVMLPEDRAKPGVVSFELEDGPRAGLYQCEVLGRGRTSEAPEPGWIRSAIDTTTIYYAPMSARSGATPVGIYDVRVISTETYELASLDDGTTIAAGPKPHFSAVRDHWYPKDADVLPIDMIWARDYQRYSQGAEFPIREGGPGAFAAQQLAHDPRYYDGPFGRSGLANHTDRYPESFDFRWRDTDGCLKVRPDCLALLDEWVAEQSAKGRRAQYDVRQTRRLNGVPSL